MDSITLKNQGKLNLNNGINIPKLLFQLKQEYRDKYNNIKDIFFKLFPNIIGLTVKETKLMSNSRISIPYIKENKGYYLSVQDINMKQPLSFENLPDGARRVLSILTYIVCANILGSVLIIFEEPASLIHPNLMQSYLSIFKQLSKGCKFIMISNSPYLLQYVNIKDIYIGKPNSKGIAYFSKFNTKKINQLMEDTSYSSTSVGNYILELLSGGKDDIRILLSYLEK